MKSLREKEHTEILDMLLAIKMFYLKNGLQKEYEDWYEYASEKEFKHYRQRVEKKYEEVNWKSS